MQPYLGSQMSELWPVVRFKFGSALAAWHPADPSALAALAPWRRVFDRREWDQLLARTVLPKLESALREFVVNPADQPLDAFEWAMAWAEARAPPQMAALLGAHFFPKWHAVLRHWLSDNPDYDEVTRWYLWWKARFPETVLEGEGVRAQMAAALNAMNSAVEGRPLEPTWTAPAPEGRAARPGESLEETYGAAHEHPRPPPTAGEAQTLRELVEAFAAEAGVEFAPKAGRTHEGLQVYHFGRVSCVVDSAHGRIQVQVGGTWAPTSMDGLLAEHGRREAAAGGRKK